MEQCKPLSYQFSIVFCIPVGKNNINQQTIPLLYQFSTVFCIRGRKNNILMRGHVMKLWCAVFYITVDPHTDKSLAKPNQIWIEITLFRLISPQT